MKNNHPSIRTAIVIILCLFIVNIGKSQCGKKDYECWLEEGIAQIEYSDFKEAKKALEKVYKGVFNKASKSLKKEAKDIRNKKTPNFYQKISAERIEGDKNRKEGFYKNAMEYYEKAEELAKRNKRFVTPHTKELDENLLTAISELLPELEAERKQAVEMTTSAGDEELSKENYPRALSNYTIALRESTAIEKASMQIQENFDKSSFFVHFNNAKDRMEAGDCETAFDEATKAVNYDSSPEVRRILGEATDCAHDHQIEAGNGQMGIGAYEAAMVNFEKAKKYQPSSTEAENGMSEAKSGAARSYVEKAKLHFENEDHAAAAEDFEMALSFNTSVVNTEGQSITSLIEEYHDALNKAGESSFAGNDFEQAAAKFNHAGFYNNKELMERRETFVLAVKAAADLEKSPNRLVTLDDLKQLQSAWGKAKKLSKETDLSGGINIEAKVKKMSKIVFNASYVATVLSKLETATQNEKNAARKGLELITIDCKFKRNGYTKLGKGLPVLTATYATPVTGPTIYSFKYHAKYARWSSSNGRTKYHLPFNVDKENLGKATAGSHLLESGTTKHVLYTHPKWVNYGSVAGYFKPITKLAPNTVLVGSIGFLKPAKNSRTDGARFKILIHVHTGNNKKVVKIFDVHKTYTGRLRRVKVDLSQYAGKKVSFELRVEAGKTATDDRAIWEGLVIKKKN